MPHRVVNQPPSATRFMRIPAATSARHDLPAVRCLHRDAHVDGAAKVTLHLLVDLEPVEPLRDALACDGVKPVERPTNTASAAAMR